MYKLTTLAKLISDISHLIKPRLVIKPDNGFWPNRGCMQVTSLIQTRRLIGENLPTQYFLIHIRKATATSTFIAHFIFPYLGVKYSNELFDNDIIAVRLRVSVLPQFNGYISQSVKLVDCNTIYRTIYVLCISIMTSSLERHLGWFGQVVLEKTLWSQNTYCG